MALTLGSLTGCGTSDAGAEPGIDARTSDVTLPDLPLSREQAFPRGPGADPRIDFLAQICRSRCHALGECEPDAPDCESACEAQLASDAKLIAGAACESAAPCADLPKCTAAPLADSPDCHRVCAMIDACDAFPHPTMGPDTATCTQACTGLLSANPERFGPTLACYEARYGQACARAGLGQCEVDYGDDEQCSEVCRRLTSECQQIPGTRFATLGECLADCGGLPALKRLQLNVCSGLAGCERLQRCYPPTDHVPEDCATFCPAWVANCGGAGVTDVVCDAACAGIVQAAPAMDLVGGASCVADAQTCLFGQGLLACIAPTYEGCPAICDALEACQLPREQCEGFCPLLYALEPAAMPELEACVLDAGCPTIFTCLQ